MESKIKIKKEQIEDYAVQKTGDQAINGIKTFEVSPIVPEATENNQVVNLGQIQDIADLKPDYSEVVLQSEKGTMSGVATLDGNGKIPLSQINDALLGNVNYQGIYNPSTNTPDLDIVIPKGHYYIIGTAGTRHGISFEIGDWIISNGTSYNKVDNTDAVSSVAGLSGVISTANLKTALDNVTNLSIQNNLGVEQFKVTDKLLFKNTTFNPITQEVIVSPVSRKTIYVNATTGNDSTAEKENYDKPYKTIDAAIAQTDLLSFWNIEMTNGGVYPVNGIIPAGSRINFVSQYASTITWSNNTNVGNLIGSTTWEISFNMPIGSVVFEPTVISFFGGQFAHLVINCKTLTVGTNFYFNRIKSLNTNIQLCNLSGQLFYWLYQSDRKNIINIDNIVGYDNTNIEIFINNMDAGTPTTFNNSSITTAGTLTLNNMPRFGTIFTANLKMITCSSSLQSYFNANGSGTLDGLSIYNFDEGVFNGRITFNMSNTRLKGKVTVVNNSSTYLFNALDVNYFDNGSMVYNGTGHIQNSRPGGQINASNYNFTINNQTSRLLYVSGPIYDYTGFRPVLCINNYSSLKHITVDSNIMEFNTPAASNVILEVNGDFATNTLLTCNHAKAISIAKTVFNLSERKKEVLVKSKNQLIGKPLLSDTNYIIDGIITLLPTDFIEVPVGGLSLSGYGFDVSAIKATTAGSTIFKSPIGGCGNLFLSNISIEASGTGSKVFDLTNAGAPTGGADAIELNVVNFENCESLGSLTNFRQGLWNNVGIFGVKDGLTFNGTWSGGFRSDLTIVRNFGTASTNSVLFKAGTDLLFKSRFWSDLNADFKEGGAISNFIPSNFNTNKLYQLRGTQITRNNVIDTTQNYTCTITAYDDVSDWTNNNGLLNSKIIVPSDIEITDSSQGVILTSPDSTRWKITISDTGVLTTTAV